MYWIHTGQVKLAILITKLLSDFILFARAHGSFRPKDAMQSQGVSYELPDLS
jgi:hypothetical protein